MISPATRKLNCFLNPSTVAHWNSNIKAAVNEGHSEKALLLFRQLKHSGLDPDNLTFPFIAKACSKLADLRYSLMIHTHVAKSPFWFDIFVQTAMVDMYVKCGRLIFAHRLFEEMPEKDVASWNAMIMGFAQSGLLDRVFLLFSEMRHLGTKPDSVTVLALMRSSFYSKNLNIVRSIHCIGIQTGIDADVFVSNSLITAYAKCGELELAGMVFDGISLCLRTVVSWNSVIGGYASLEKSAEAINFYRSMCPSGFRPDLCTIIILLSSCVNHDTLFQGKMIHSHIIQLGFNLDISASNTLISMYSKCRDIDSARFVFNGMLERTSVSWTAMIGGYANKGDMDEALALFYAMEADGKEPDLVTMVAVLSACGQTGALEIGRSLNRYAVSKGLDCCIMVCNALIDMYARCGSISDALDVFDMIPEKTVVSWTTMISGYALNGKYKESLDLFFRMVELGLEPNHLTFLAVLQACTHAGLLEKGWLCFKMMNNIYKISPWLEHYACMVDLLGRRGKLIEALDFIQNMPVEPDGAIWGALLSACKIYGEMAIAEYASCRLFGLDPHAAVSYVTMANIYAAEGRWEDVAKVRAMMKCNRVKKSPGHSLVQVNGNTRMFTSDHTCPPEDLLIYEVLDGLALHMKDKGFRSCIKGILVKNLEH